MSTKTPPSTATSTTTRSTTTASPTTSSGRTHSASRPSAIGRPAWLDPELYPFTVRTADLPAGPVAYVDEGQGPTLLFVHAGMWSFVFRDAIERLRHGFRCITLDFPGYGTSPDADHPLTVGEISEVLGAFIDWLELDRFTLVVHDLGGPVSLAAAETRSDRIEALVLCNTFLWTPDTFALKTMFRVIGSRPMAVVGTATNLVARLTSGRFGVGRNLDRRERRLFRQPYRKPMARWRFHATMRSALHSPEVTNAAHRVAAGPLAERPVLTIFGENNDPFGFQARHGEIFSDHQDIVVDGGNHFPMMDDPDLFATAIRRWHDNRVRTDPDGKTPTDPDGKVRPNTDGKTPTDPDGKACPNTDGKTATDPDGKVRPLR